MQAEKIRDLKIDAFKSLVADCIDKELNAFKDELHLHLENQFNDTASVASITKLTEIASKNFEFISKIFDDVRDLSERIRELERLAKL